jgi:hypothetical protein
MIGSRYTQLLNILEPMSRIRSSVSHEFVQRNGDLRKVAQDLAIDSQQPNSLRMRQRDELTVIRRTDSSSFVGSSRMVPLIALFKVAIISLFKLR